MTRFIYAFLLLSLSTLAACAPTAEPPCGVLAADFITEFDPLIERFYDAALIADSSPRMSLPGPVADLQAIRRELDAIDTDLPCARSVQQPALTYMDHIIEGIILFMRDEPKVKITNEIKIAVENRTAFMDARAAIDDEIQQATREANE